ncbi:hypothetical protein ABID16_003087 [Rhizobium aquaticum]|uniref:Uncharacterized protein n=1 Tax=Rhizobium aquaticum TaxID=1549636 RepID=A0ABV2J433_9HYPH
MSDNPIAFDAIRKAAYAWANVHGKDEAGLRLECLSALRLLRERGQVSSAFTQEEGEQVVQDVVAWTLQRYNPAKPKPKRDREERASTFLLMPAAYEEAANLYGKSTLRGTARITEQSKSTVGRHMQRQGVAPRRNRKIAALSKSAQRLLELLDSTFYRRDSGIIKPEWLIHALWPMSGANEPTPRTTQKSREKRLNALIEEVSKGGVGYHFFRHDDIFGVMRGRRFSGYKDAAIWIEEQARLNRFVSVERPSPKAMESSLFWEDAVVRDVFTIMGMSRTGVFYPFERVASLFRFERFLLDPTPIVPWLERAYRSDMGPDIGENLAYLSGNITDEATGKAIGKLGARLDRLHKFSSPYEIYSDTLVTVDMELGVLQYCRENAPLSYARLAFIQEILANQEYSELDVEDWYEQMIEAEKAGEWIAPSPEVLGQYLPADETTENP